MQHTLPIFNEHGEQWRMERKDIANYSVTEQLKNGRQVTIRAIRPEDRGQVAVALKDLSPQSFYLRMFSPKREMSESDLRGLTEIDFDTVVGLVAVVKEKDRLMIVGGGRYVRMGPAAPDAAEVAFLVDDGHQGAGIGSLIFKHLITIARASGIMRFEAEVLPTNDGMLRLFERSGLTVTKTMARDSVHITIDLKTEP
jgi:RimJ/RimL family protein N-acetyltransferase